MRSERSEVNERANPEQKPLDGELNRRVVILARRAQPSRRSACRRAEPSCGCTRPRAQTSRRSARRRAEPSCGCARRRVWPSRESARPASST
ncbi:hypothetical protein F2Q69_00034570 [Brassica cretica]|uniref:Uncharacterized protein n=1 Tax=Brassica cretica TaxID=69181 RepID=A0A8S9SKD3_BRACR|nr:hypothetical protein F2Q69_00034570 [Brassica cretica]